MLRSSRGLARIPLERNGIDHPVERLVPRDDAALSVQLDDLAADRDALFLRVVPVGVVEECLIFVETAAGDLVSAYFELGSPVTKNVPPFPGFETSWPDLEKILSGTVRMS